MTPASPNLSRSFAPLPAGPWGGPGDKSLNPSILYTSGATFTGDNFNFGKIEVSDDGLLKAKILDEAGEPMYCLKLSPQK